MGGLIYHDFIQKFYKARLSESKGAVIMKIIVLINGIIYLIATPFLEKMKYLIQVCMFVMVLKNSSYPFIPHFSVCIHNLWINIWSKIGCYDSCNYVSKVKFSGMEYVRSFLLDVIIKEYVVGSYMWNAE